MKLTRTKRGLSTLAVLILSACGGGGGGGGGEGGGGVPFGMLPATTATPSTAPATGTTVTSSSASLKLQGVAATGAAFVNAEVTVTDRNGAAICATLTDQRGGYTCELPPETVGPLAIAAKRDSQSLYSATADAGGIANITPLTTVLASRLTLGGDPALLSEMLRINPEAVTPARLTQEVATLTTALRPLLEVLGQTGLNPISSPLVADGSGHDRVLDALSVTLRPDGTAANIEITRKSKLVTPAEAPPSLIFRSSDASIPVLPASITASQFDGMPSQAAVQSLLDRMNACYALPLSQRVQTAADDVAATGTSASVTANACRSLFAANDPSTYLNQGARVGRNDRGEGGMTSLFMPSATGRLWTEGKFEHFAHTGDSTLTLSWTDADGSTNSELLVVRHDGGALRLAGDKYAYNAAANGFAELRDQLRLPQYNAYHITYSVQIANLQSGGQPVFSRVLVTSPLGVNFVYVPQTGLSFMVSAQIDGVTPTTFTNVYSLSAAYTNPETPGHLSQREPSLVFASPQYTDERIRNLKDQGVWTFEFVHRDTAQPNVIQHHRTLGRVPTLAELRHTSLVDLTPAMRALLSERAQRDAGWIFDAPDSGEPNTFEFQAEGGADAWVIAAGGLPMRQLTIYGFAPRNVTTGAQGHSFDDNSGLLPTRARKTRVLCSREGTSDLHCADDNGLFAQNSRIHFFNLSMRTPQRVALARKVLFY